MDDVREKRSVLSPPLARGPKSRRIELICDEYVSEILIARTTGDPVAPYPIHNSAPAQWYGRSRAKAGKRVARNSQP